MKKNIGIILYNYKSSNLIKSVESIYENVSDKSSVHLTVYDQHPLVREEKLRKFPRLKYEHVFWDHQYSPITYKQKYASENPHEFFMSISADITLKKDWDLRLIEFADSHPSSIISGMGSVGLGLRDKYTIKSTWLQSEEEDDFSISNYIDRNFIFCKSDAIQRVQFPVNQKYLGEEEFLSINAFKNGVGMYSCPSNYYLDNKERNLERLYSPFSIEHKYNDFIDYLNSPPEDDILYIEKFFSLHGLDFRKLVRIPYQVDDVLYDPNTLKIVSIGGERYIDSVKAIY